MTTRVILQCQVCNREDASWTHSDFMSRMWAKVTKKKILTQYCFNCCKYTEHHIVGMFQTRRFEFKENDDDKLLSYRTD